MCLQTVEEDDDEGEAEKCIISSLFAINIWSVYRNDAGA